MKKTELQERCAVMFPQYPDIVNVSQLQKMLGISRHLADVLRCRAGGVRRLQRDDGLCLRAVRGEAQRDDLIREGYLAGFRIGNAYRVPKVSIIRYIMELEVKFRGC